MEVVGGAGVMEVVGGGVEVVGGAGGGVEAVVGGGGGGGAGIVKATAALTEGREASSTNTWCRPGATSVKVHRLGPEWVNLPSRTYLNLCEPIAAAPVSETRTTTVGITRAPRRGERIRRCAGGGGGAGVVVVLRVVASATSAALA